MGICRNVITNPSAPSLCKLNVVLMHDLAHVTQPAVTVLMSVNSSPQTDLLSVMLTTTLVAQFLRSSIRMKGLPSA